MQRAYRCKHGSYRNSQSGCCRGNGCEKDSRRRMGSHIHEEKFFPILETRVTSLVFCEGVSSPAYASLDPRSGLKHAQLQIINFGPLRGNNQPGRCFITAATGAFRLLKVLKYSLCKQI